MYDLYDLNNWSVLWLTSLYMPKYLPTIWDYLNGVYCSYWWIVWFTVPGKSSLPGFTNPDFDSVFYLYIGSSYNVYCFKTIIYLHRTFSIFGYMRTSPSDLRGFINVINISAHVVDLNMCLYVAWEVGNPNGSFEEWRW